MGICHYTYIFFVMEGTKKRRTKWLGSAAPLKICVPGVGASTIIARFSEVHVVHIL